MSATNRHIRNVYVIVLLAAAYLILLTHCGISACIGGIGVHGQDDCAGGTSVVNSSGTGSFQLTVSPTSVVVGQTAQVTASGGTAGPYTYTIDPNSNPAPSSALSGSINSSSGLYQAPSTISPSASETVTIRATDTTGAFRTVTVTVTSG